MMKKEENPPPFDKEAERGILRTAQIKSLERMAAALRGFATAFTEYASAETALIPLNASPPLSDPVGTPYGTGISKRADDTWEPTPRTNGNGHVQPSDTKPCVKDRIARILADAPGTVLSVPDFQLLMPDVPHGTLTSNLSHFSRPDVLDPPWIRVKNRKGCYTLPKTPLKKSRRR